MILSFLLISTGKVSMSCNNFAVDASGKLYVGKKYSIEVYENGDLIKTINPLSSRTYAFTIQNDNTILLSTSSIEYLLDLKGNIISSKEDVGSSTYNKIKKNNSFVSTSGKTYELKSCFGKYSIVCDNIIVYEMPKFDYIIKLLYNSSYFVFFIGVVVIIWKQRKV